MEYVDWELLDLEQDERAVDWANKVNYGISISLALTSSFFLAEDPRLFVEDYWNYEQPCWTCPFAISFGWFLGSRSYFPRSEELEKLKSNIRSLPRSDERIQILNSFAKMKIQKPS